MRRAPAIAGVFLLLAGCVTAYVPIVFDDGTPGVLIKHCMTDRECEKLAGEACGGVDFRRISVEVTERTCGGVCEDYSTPARGEPFAWTVKCLPPEGARCGEAGMSCLTPERLERYQRFRDEIYFRELGFR